MSCYFVIKSPSVTYHRPIEKYALSIDRISFSPRTTSAENDPNLKEKGTSLYHSSESMVSYRIEIITLNDKRKLCVISN